MAACCSWRSPTPTRASSSSPTNPYPIQLPGGTHWWQGLGSGASTNARRAAARRRPPSGGETQRRQQQTHVELPGGGLWQQQEEPRGLVRVPSPPPKPVPHHSGLPLVLSGSSLASGCVVIDTEYEVLPPRPTSFLLPPSPPSSATAGGLVWVNAGGASGLVAAAPGEAPSQQRPEAAAPAVGRRGSGRHPRRTQMVRFTCNLCTEVNEAEVNPHAWAKGSVFARCQGCTAVHKLRDNLRIFHELAGPVFPPPELRSTYLVQEILDRIQERKRSPFDEGHPAP